MTLLSMFLKSEPHASFKMSMLYIIYCISQLNGRDIRRICVCIPNLAPVAVILDTVNGQGDHLHASFLELITDLGGAGELSGADRSEVPRVGEQDTPSTEENRHKNN